MIFYGSTTIANWSVTYEKAIRDDGTLLFPEKLDQKELESKRREMGSYLFANQYLNIIIPDEERKFRPEWVKHWTTLPEIVNTYAFIDPAIGQKKHHDYTAVVVIDVDCDANWYVRVANRYRLTPSQIVDKCFELHRLYRPRAIGIEVVAYQEALLYILDEQMKKRQMLLPVTGIKRNAVSKETRILQLVPMMEWGRLFLAGKMSDLEDELFSFPRGAHDDLIDSLVSCVEIVSYPQKASTEIKQPHSPHDKNYEKWVIQNLVKKANQGDNDNG